MQETFSIRSMWLMLLIIVALSAGSVVSAQEPMQQLPGAEDRA